MPIVGQEGRWFYAFNWEGHAAASKTIQIHTRDVSAEIALTSISLISEDTYSSWAEIRQIVSDRGVEDFPFGEPVIFRKNVTSITFIVKVYRCMAVARCIINLWS